MGGDDYRHEHKYVCTQAQLALLKIRARAILKPDKHAGSSGGYAIRSLYFDDLFNACYYENENGTDPREKLRIRIYNCDCDFISLELKKKERGMTQKSSCRISREQCEMLISGKIPYTDKASPPLLRKLCIHMRTRLFQPTVIVDYNRIPFICAAGNVRVTFDENIASSDNINRFFEKDIRKRPVMPSGQHILEVKWDAFLPDYIKKSLQTENLTHSAFSKYYLCKKYNIRGLI